MRWTTNNKEHKLEYSNVIRLSKGFRPASYSTFVSVMAVLIEFIDIDPDFLLSFFLLYTPD